MAARRPDRSGNGWRQGRDPVQRWLRILTALVCLGVFVFLTVAGRGIDDVPIIALAMGALLLLLGYEGVVRLPTIDRLADMTRRDSMTYQGPSYFVPEASTSEETGLIDPATEDQDA